ncbi:MAG: flagellar transcriptional regulator FlhC [Burkholderiales bacterium]
MTKNRSVVGDAREVDRAIKLILLGARLQLLESEVSLSRERLLRLYKEIHRKSPPKGMLPFSTDWFMAWQPNVHSSLFLGIYEYLQKSSELEEIDAIIKAYQLYMEHVGVQGIDAVLSITRAWRLVKFVDAGMLCTAVCTSCKGNFVVHSGDLHDKYRCGLCHMPALAGKTAKAARELVQFA